MSPEELADFEALKYARSVIRVAAASLSPDAQIAFVQSFNRFNSSQVQAFLAPVELDEKDIKRAGGGVWSAAKDFVSGILGTSPSPEKVEELAEHIAGRQLSATQLAAIRQGIGSKGAEATMSWLTGLIMRVAAGSDIMPLPAGSPTIVP